MQHLKKEENCKTAGYRETMETELAEYWDDLANLF